MGESSGASQLVNIGIALFLPFLIRQLLGWCRGRGQVDVGRAAALAMKHKKKKTGESFDRSLKMVLMAVVAWNLLNAWVWKPSNVLATLQVTSDNPSYILRRKMMEHVTKLMGGGDQGQEWARALVSEQEAKFMEMQPNKDLIRLRTMYDTLKDNDRRVLYLTHGEDAYFGCRWCSKSNSEDFNLYNTPWFLLQYVGMMGLVIVVTSRPGMGSWRYYSVIALVCLFFYCDFFLPMSTELNPKKTWDSLYEFRNRIRRSIFALIALVLLVVKPSDEVTNDDILAAMVDQHQQILSTLNATRMQRAAVMEDDNLRRAYFDFAKTRSAANNLVNSDQEVEAARQQAIQKYNLDKIFPADEQLIDSIINQALNGPVVDSHDE